MRLLDDVLDFNDYRLSEAACLAGPGASVLPPASLEAEQSVLGAILLDPDVLVAVAAIIPPQQTRVTFTREAHAFIYDAMLTLHERRDPIDLVSLTDILRRRGHIEKVKGSTYMAELMERATTSINAEHHARIVREKAMLRAVINIGTSITADAYEARDLQEILGFAQRSIQELSSTGNEASFAEVHTLLHQAIRQAGAVTGDELLGLTTGFPDLDQRTSGLQRSDLIIVAARPAMGKTSLAMQLAIAASSEHQAQSVIFFSLEMSKEQLAIRLLCGEARVNSQAFRRGQLSPDQWNNIMGAADRLSPIPLLIDDTSSLSPLDIRARVNRIQAERGVGMIIVDYLQLLRSTKSSSSRQQEISEISRDLKIMAKDFNIPVVALSPLSRAIEHRNNGVPQLSDLRECITGDQIIYDAHTGHRTTVRAIAEGRTTFVNGLDRHMKTTSARVSMAWSTGIKPVLKLRTRTGRTLRATANHPIRRLEGWAPLAAIRVGECIAVPREVPEPPLAIDLLSDDELKVLGYLISDGHYAKHRTISYVKADPALCADVRRIAFERFGIIAKSKRCKGIAEEMDLTGPGTGPGSNELINWLKSLGIHGQIGANKRVPEILWSHTNRALAVFLGALWAGDGSVVPRKRGGWVLKFTNTSMGLLDDVQWLLTRLGILSVRGPIERNSKSKLDISTISIGEAEAILRFADLVPMLGVKGHKLQMASAHLSMIGRNASIDRLPLAVTAHVQELRRALGMSYQQLGYRPQGKRMCRADLARVASRLGDESLCALSQGDILWDEVVSIEADGCEEVFDLTVPGLHNFVVSNIFTHNSGALEQDADVIMFLYKEAHSDEAQSTLHRDDLDQITNIMIAKQRNGPTGPISLLFNRRFARFDNLARESDYPTPHALEHHGRH
jgi:replicative DNA helicase